MAVDTARRAGTSLGSYLLSEELDASEFQPMPSFWSDQYEMRVQSFGMPLLGTDDVRVLEGDVETEAAVGYHRGDTLVGVVLLGLSARHSHYRLLIAQSSPRRGGGVPRRAGRQRRSPSGDAAVAAVARP